MPTKDISSNTESLRLLFTQETHVVKVDKDYYNKGILGYSFLLNYLHLLTRGTAIMRCCGEADAPDPSWAKVSGELIDVAPIPEYPSLSGMIKSLPAIFRAVKRATKQTDRTIVRLPGVCGLPVALCLWLQRRKYGIEFVGHATESVIEQYAKQGKRPGFMVKLLDWATHFFVRRSVAVAYRSEYLRATYPHGNPDREIIFSGAQLHKEVITGPRSVECFNSEQFRITYVGRIMAEKGCHILLEAFAKALQHSSKALLLRMVGDGGMIPELEARAAELGISDKVEFAGRIPWGPELFAMLDDSQLFVLPSLTEGMPRSVIEAMARGMPALGSNCGGIPELLEEENLFTPGDDNALAEKLIELSNHPEKLVAMSERNFEASKQHWPENLNREKDRFWKLVALYAK